MNHLKTDLQNSGVRMFPVFGSPLYTTLALKDLRASINLTRVSYSRSKLTHLSEKCRQSEKSLKELSARNESELTTLKGQLNRKVADVKKNEEEFRKRKVTSLKIQDGVQNTVGI